MLQTELETRAKFAPAQPKTGLPQWRVLATFPNGAQVQIGDFRSPDEAEEWIRRKSAEWLELKRMRAASLLR